jgi:hypothetical protein
MLLWLIANTDALLMLMPSEKQSVKTWIGLDPRKAVAETVDHVAAGKVMCV